MILNATRGCSRLVGNFSREEPLECHATSTGPTQPLPRGGGWIADLAVIAAISFAALCLAWQAGSGIISPWPLRWQRYLRDSARSTARYERPGVNTAGHRHGVDKAALVVGRRSVALRDRAHARPSPDAYVPGGVWNIGGHRQRFESTLRHELYGYDCGYGRCPHSRSHLCYQ
jgi:hypothetical protein